MKRITELGEDVAHAVGEAFRKLRPAEWRRPLGAIGVAGAVAALIWAVVSGPLSSGEDEPKTATRVVTLTVTNEPESVGVLGFPVTATRNTTRVPGGEPISDAAAVALATHPAPDGADSVEAVVLIDASDWQGGIAASALTGPPLRLPLLLSSGSAIPGPTSDAIERLAPKGGGTADASIYSIGAATEAAGSQGEPVEGTDPATLAVAIDELRQKLTGTEPEHVLVVPDDAPEMAMPAAAWAARSGDPVFFTGRDEVPDATLKALRRHSSAAVYILGPESAVSQKALRQIVGVSPRTTRVGAEGATANSIEFARFADSGFGWNINDPGHGIVIASTTRPLDAAAAAALSASGQWGPLLVVESPDAVPAELESFLLDIKPGYRDDPTRAVYNRLWLIGDDGAIGIGMQAELDGLAEVADIATGSGGIVDDTGAGPATTFPGISEPEQKKPDKEKSKP